MRNRSAIALLVLVCCAILLVPAASAGKPGRGKLYLDGVKVRTLVPPAATPQEGRDPLFSVQGGVDGQLGIASVGPGSGDYHGGQWAVYVVTWNVEPYLLTSDEAVHAAEATGDVDVVRSPDADFKCPIQP